MCGVVVCVDVQEAYIENPMSQRDKANHLLATVRAWRSLSNRSPAGPLAVCGHGRFCQEGAKNPSEWRPLGLLARSSTFHRCAPSML